MPRRSILSSAEKQSLLALPDTREELIRHYALSERGASKGPALWTWTRGPRPGPVVVPGESGGDSAGERLPR